MSSEVATSLAIAACWSLSTFVNKIALGSLSTELVYATTATISFLASWGIVIWKKPDMKELWKEAAENRYNPIFLWVCIAFFVSVAARYVFLGVLKKTDKTYIVVTLTNTVPIFVAILCWLFLKERFTPLSVCGVIITTIGIAMLSLSMTKA